VKAPVADNRRSFALMGRRLRVKVVMLARARAE
jgi:hypothetical protein